MQIKVRQVGDNSVVEVAGDLDMSTSPQLRETLLDLLQEPSASTLVVSMKEVNYIDSSGIASLVEALQVARRTSTKLVLASLNDGPRHVLQLTRLIDVFAVYPSEAEALGA